MEELYNCILIFGKNGLPYMGLFAVQKQWMGQFNEFSKKKQTT